MFFEEILFVLLLWVVWLKLSIRGKDERSEKLQSRHLENGLAELFSHRGSK